MGLNFGVLIAWIAVSLVTVPLFQAFVRRRQVREWRRSMGQRSEAHLGDEERASMSTTQG